MASCLENDLNMKLEFDSFQKDKYLTFNFGKEEYGIDINDIIEIVGIQEITEITEAPNYVMGVIDLRGKIIPVVDMRMRLKKDYREYDDRTCIIIVSVNNLFVGLIVDIVLDVIKIDDKNISPPPSLTNMCKQKYIKGIGKIENSIKIILDCNKLLYEEDVETLKKVK